ncbi:MAG: GGDEF domain-containing protein, partial [Phreatobacter sp.]|nr:GGDEF domain-containing protein [Phreatobacter sp.]
NLYGTLPIFLGGAANTLGIALLIAWWRPTPAILVWCALEVIVTLARLGSMAYAYRAAARGHDTLTDLNILLAVAWGFTTGLGAGISLIGGDWSTAIVVCISAAGMVGGMCFRYVCAPRLATAVIAGALLPATAGALLSGNAILLISAVQAPALLFAMSKAAFSLHRLLVATMMAEREHKHRAGHDPLTGLVNRTGLAREFDHRLANAGAGAFALLYLDLDGFKAVNDTHGHLVGDRVLCMVADRLRATLEPGDLAARLGGDEFVVLAATADEARLGEIASRLLTVITAPYPLADTQAAEIGVSIGIACAPQDGSDFVALMTRADAALYIAKARGKARYALASEVDEAAHRQWDAMRHHSGEERDTSRLAAL